MPRVTLIRHGQAGTRDDYDNLSGTGIRQARLLGGWLRQRGAAFDEVLCGSLARQKHTAELVLGGDSARLKIDPGWNEFDLDGVFLSLAPRLAASDPGFASRWGELQQVIADGGAEIHRQWTPTDSEVVFAWLYDRFGEIDGVESWPSFRDRIRRAFHGLGSLGDEAKVAVFTSALPAAICIGEALGLEAAAMLSLAGSSHNTGMTELRLSGGRAELISFNVTSHLPDGLVTHR
jgi:broad specificity phosphatase PhoE